MIVDRGIDDFSLRRLAARLGVTAPSLYRFFDSKDAIVAAIAETAFAELIDAIEQSAVGLDDPVAQIKARSRMHPSCRWTPDQGTRIGVMPRRGTGADIRWFDVDNQYVVHLFNAWDAGDRVQVR